MNRDTVLGSVDLVFAAVFTLILAVSVYLRRRRERRRGARQ